MPNRTAELIGVHPLNPEPKAIERAARLLAAGELVVLPTDTVYGVAADPQVSAAVERLYTVKGRETRKPVPLLVASVAEVERRGGVMGHRARRLAERYWPGPLTLVLPTASGTEGFRVPNHAVTLAVLRAVGGALRVTSANRSGAPAARDAAAALAALGKGVRLVLDAGVCPLGIESTVVQEEGGELRVLREGAIPAGEILARPLILFVCTANVCRSPMAEYLLRHWLGADAEWEVASAGLSAVEGMPITPEAAQVLAEKGIDASRHTSRFLTAALVDAAEVVVVMTNAHRELLEQRYPECAGKVFLLKSFGYPGEDEDIPDPIGQPLELYRKVRDEMDAIMPDLVLDLRRGTDRSGGGK